MSFTEQEVAEIRAYALSEVEREKWGMLWPRGTKVINAELACLRAHLLNEGGPLNIQKPESDPYGHFIRLVQMCFPSMGRKGIYITPWFERMAKGVIEHQYCAISGPSSSGKSLIAAALGLLVFFSDPRDTSIPITSTSLDGGRGRVWARLKELYAHFRSIYGDFGATVNGEVIPLKFFSSPDMLKLDHRDIDIAKSIRLIAADSKHESEASSKLIGLKSQFVYLIADEATDISRAVFEAAFGNLDSNDVPGGRFRMLCMGNFASAYDEFGKFCEPVNGWASVDKESTGWETQRGYCVHIDGEEVRYLNPQGEIPFMPTPESVDKFMKENEAYPTRIWRFLHSFPAPAGVTSNVFSEADFIYTGAENHPNWADKTIMVAGVDPSYSDNGDRFVVCLGKVGETTEGNTVIDIVDLHVLSADPTRKDIPLNVQRARMLIELLDREKVSPQNVAIDAGGGLPFCDLLASQWSNEFLRVNFGAAAADHPIFPHHTEPAKELYANMGTQLWFTAKEFTIARQIRGMRPDLARELVARNLDKTSRRLRVESKTDMRLTGKTGNRSPDLADAFVLMCHAARVTLGLEPYGTTQVPVNPISWKKRIMNRSLRSSQEVLSCYSTSYES